MDATILTRKVPPGGSTAVDRVAVLSYHSSPLAEPGTGDSGGMTVYVRELAEELATRGVSTDIFTRATSTTPRTTRLSPRVRVVAIEAGPPEPLPKDELPDHLPDYTTGIRAFTTSQRISYDIVHSHYWQSGLAGFELARAWDVPLVHSHHTLGRVKNRFLAPGDSAEPQSRLDGESQVIGAADVLLASTDEEWEQLACLYGASHDRVKTLHPGVDHRLFKPGDRAAARRELGLEDEAVMLYVGRIQPLKGLELAVRAAEELASALDRPLVFLVVGGASGPVGAGEIGGLSSLAEQRGIGDVVRFVGPQPHTRLPAYYRAADTLVMCSYSESFGLAALEAHACGTPVVATAVGGLRHIVRDGESGFLLDTRDPASFAGKLKTLLGDPNLQSSFQAQAELAAAGFSWQRTADEMLDLYECLAEERLPEACVC